MCIVMWLLLMLINTNWFGVLNGDAVLKQCRFVPYLDRCRISMLAACRFTNVCDYSR